MVIARLHRGPPDALQLQPAQLEGELIRLSKLASLPFLCVRRRASLLQHLRQTNEDGTVNLTIQLYRLAASLDLKGGVIPRI